MEEQDQDCVICGTGINECILSALLSKKGFKILQIDRNDQYGGEGASLNITTLYKEFFPNEKVPENLGHNRHWNVDLIPKFILAGGKLVQMLLQTTVTKQLEWQPVDQTYVVQNTKSGMFSSGGLSVSQVPGSAKEALSSNLMGIFQKKKCFNFLKWIDSIVIEDKSTWTKHNIANETLGKVLDSFGLDKMTTDFIIHAVALLPNDLALEQPATEAIRKIKVYMQSHGKYGNKSPFIYPMQGLGGLPEGFSRLCAIHGGTYMLNKNIDGFKYDENGKVCGVTSGSETAKCKFVVCDPTQAKHKCKITAKILRVICILEHPMESTKKADCCQVIIPQRQTGRQNDIYILTLSQKHAVCNKGFYLAIISTKVETNNPEKEIELAYSLLGNITHKFSKIQDYAEPTDDGSKDNIFVPKSLNDTSHFQEETSNVIDIYQKITGEILDFSKMPETINDEE